MTGLFCSESLGASVSGLQNITYKDSFEASQKFYAALRYFDEKGCKVILSEEVEKKEIGTALANRMEKAAVKCYL